MSYKFKGTPGNWWLSEIDGGFGGNGGISIDSKHPEYEANFEVAEVWGIDDYTVHDDRSQANAQLIAAAPLLRSIVANRALSGDNLCADVIKAIDEGDNEKMRELWERVQAVEINV